MEPANLAILYTDNDETLTRQVSSYLAERRMAVLVALTIADARQLLSRHHFDLLLLEPAIEDDDALGLIRTLSLSGPPIIIASTRGDEVDRVVALEMGAVDYLTKPFSIAELAIRIRIATRRASGRSLASPRVARFDRWRLDFAAHRAIDDGGGAVDFTSGEIALLRVLLENPQRVLRRHELLALTRQDDAEVFERTVDVIVARVRGKLERDSRRPLLIRTVRGSGYRFSEPVHWEVPRLNDHG